MYRFCRLGEADIPEMRLLVTLLVVGVSAHLMDGIDR